MRTQLVYLFLVCAGVAPVAQAEGSVRLVVDRAAKPAKRAEIKSMREALGKVLEHYATWKKENPKKKAKSLDDIGLPEELALCPEPGGGEGKKWIWIGENFEIAAKQSRVIAVAPFEVDGKRVIGLANGKTAVSPDPNFGELLKKLGLEE